MFLKGGHVLPGRVGARNAGKRIFRDPHSEFVDESNFHLQRRCLVFVGPGR